MLAELAQRVTVDVEQWLVREVDGPESMTLQLQTTTSVPLGPVPATALRVEWSAPSSPTFKPGSVFILETLMGKILASFDVPSPSVL